MKKPNSRKNDFIRSLEQVVSQTNRTKFKTCAFCFRFFDSSQCPPGQDFKEWNQDELQELFNKLKAYSSNTLEHWKQQRIGTKDGRVLTIYGNFPSHSEFKRPTFVPERVEWGRFRLEGEVRLPGFIATKETVEKSDLKYGVFYVVFLDKNHKFYSP